MFIFKSLKNTILLIKSSDPKVKLKQICSSVGIQIKALPQDIRTRQNSTYNMLRKAIPYQTIIDIFIFTKLPDIYIFSDQQKIIEVIYEFLSKFERVTRLFSGVYYLTTNLIFYELTEIIELFSFYERKF